MKPSTYREEGSHSIDAARAAATLASLLALGVLMVGQYTSDARLTVSEIPINLLVLPAIGAFAILLPIRRDLRMELSLPFALLVPLSMALIWSMDPARGAVTLINLLASAFTAALLLMFAISKIGISSTFRVWVAASAVLLLAAIAYKFERGLFDRNVNFFLNGPNVFARHMGLAAILAAYFVAGTMRWLLALFFFSAVVWTQSKGPLLALSLVGLWFAWLRLQWRGRALLLSLILLALVSLAASLEAFQDVPLFKRIVIALAVFDTGLNAENYGSIGSRVYMFGLTTEMIGSMPLGVGLGGWAAAAGIDWADYPHNLFLELFSEAGIVIAAVSSLAFLCFLTSRHPALVCSCWFLLLCQQVSGGLADARFLLAFSSVAFALRIVVSAERSDAERASIWSR